MAKTWGMSHAIEDWKFLLKKHTSFFLKRAIISEAKKNPQNFAKLMFSQETPHGSLPIEALGEIFKGMDARDATWIEGVTQSLNVDQLCEAGILLRKNDSPFAEIGLKWEMEALAANPKAAASYYEKRWRDGYRLDRILRALQTSRNHFVLRNAAVALGRWADAYLPKEKEAVWNCFGDCENGCNHFFDINELLPKLPRFERSSVISFAQKVLGVMDSKDITYDGAAQFYSGFLYQVGQADDQKLFGTMMTTFKRIADEYKKQTPSSEQDVETIREGLDIMIEPLSKTLGKGWDNKAAHHFNVSRLKFVRHLMGLERVYCVVGRGMVLKEALGELSGHKQVPANLKARLESLRALLGNDLRTLSESVWERYPQLGKPRSSFAEAMGEDKKWGREDVCGI